MTNKLYTIIDIETTGSYRGGNKITEIAIIKFDGAKVIDEFSTLINPEMNIPIAITYLTGINNEMVAHAPKFYEIAKKIIQMTEDCIFVAHNVFFDYNFIKHEFAELGYQFNREKLCTVRLARKFLAGYKSYSLGNICSDLNINIENRHRAMGDARATVELFKKIIASYPDAVKDFVQGESKKVALPKNLPRDEFEKVPSLPGVYYFYNIKGDLLYIGKSKDLKKRVSSHFRLNMKRPKDIELKNLVAKIDYKLMGNELAALLYECQEIKKYKPKFNISLKRSGFPIAIDLKKNKKGILEIRAFKREQESDYAYTFRNKNKAQLKINSFYRALLATEPGSLNFENILQTFIQKIGISEYNKMLEKIFNQEIIDKKDYTLNLKGRTNLERSYIVIKDGKPTQILFGLQKEIKKKVKLIPDQDMLNIFYSYQKKHSSLFKKSICKN